MKLRRYVGRVIPPVLFVLLLPIALAAPIEVVRDRADNFLTFSFDDDDDDLSIESSRRVKQGDRVEFFTIVGEQDGAQPFFGRITLRLVSPRAVTYNGRFTFVVRDLNGAVAFKGTRQRSFTLRPKTGKRFRSMRFVFDVPSGDYQVTARFVMSE